VGLDLRIPVGTLFAVIGALLGAYGTVTLGEPGTAPTGVPINLVWGLVLLAFGMAMLALARRARRAARRASHPDAGVGPRVP
jgi:cation transporter-like permease